MMIQVRTRTAAFLQFRTRCSRMTMIGVLGDQTRPWLPLEREFVRLHACHFATITMCQEALRRVGFILTWAYVFVDHAGEDISGHL